MCRVLLLLYLYIREPHLYTSQNPSKRGMFGYRCPFPQWDGVVANYHRIPTLPWGACIQYCRTRLLFSLVGTTHRVHHWVFRQLHANDVHVPSPSFCGWFVIVAWSALQQGFRRLRSRRKHWFGLLLCPDGVFWVLSSLRQSQSLV